MDTTWVLLADEGRARILAMREPGTDLGVALAAASSFASRPLRERTVAIGEVSLSGEVRRVARVESRVREAARLGFARAGVPAVQAGEAKVPGIEIVPLATLREAIEALLGAKVERAPRAEGNAEREEQGTGAGGRRGDTRGLGSGER